MPHMIPAPGAFAAGVAIFLIVIWDAFEAIILPRRVTRRFRLTRLFYKTTWTTWKFIIGLVSSRKGRETLLGFFLPDLAADFCWRVGRGTRTQFWANAIRSRVGRGHDRSTARLCDRSVS